MIEFVREFVVREEARGQFELVYGPGGAWSSLFARCAGFRGTTLLRDVKDRRRYLVVELWEREGLREQAQVAHEGEYASLEASFAAWAESKRELGLFRILTEATVRARGGAGRGEGRERGRGIRRTIG